MVNDALGCPLLTRFIFQLGRKIKPETKTETKTRAHNWPKQIYKAAHAKEIEPATWPTGKEVKRMWQTKLWAMFIWILRDTGDTGETGNPRDPKVH